MKNGLTIAHVTSIRCRVTPAGGEGAAPQAKPNTMWSSHHATRSHADRHTRPHIHTFTCSAIHAFTSARTLAKFAIAWVRGLGRLNVCWMFATRIHPSTAHGNLRFGCWWRTAGSEFSHNTPFS